MSVPGFLSFILNMITNFIDRVKFIFRKDKELLSALYDILGFYPHNLEIFRIALAHKSQAYRNTSGRPLNNERLEFLGDAILEAVVSDIVFHRYSRKREGFLTSTRSKIVQRESLNRLAREIGLERLVRTTACKNAHNSYIGGNAFEALIGAIYLDRGYALCKWFVEKRIIGRLLDLDGVAQTEVNFKSKLLEWTQKNRIEADYKLEQTENPGSNNPVFCSIVTIEGIEAGRGTGYSKKESHQQAAKEALTKLRREPKFADSIFRAKEKRTAMEAGEVCALPRIKEIEDEIVRSKNRSGSRHARRAPQPPASKEKENAQPAPLSSDGEEASVAPKRRRSRTKKTTATNETVPAETAQVEIASSVAEEQSSAPTAENTVPRKPRRRGRSKKSTAAISGENSGNEQSDSRPKSQPDNDREDIIRQAEEAAFRSDTGQ